MRFSALGRRRRCIHFLNPPDFVCQLGSALAILNRHQRDHGGDDGHVWRFGMDKQAVQAAGFEVGVFNCYATSIKQVQSVFRHRYFERVWTFPEMLLGKMITMSVINGGRVSPLGELDAWVNLASDAKDKAVKLHDWTNTSSEVKSAAVNAILGLVEEDVVVLTALQIQVQGISSARIDIISGGPSWWVETHPGIATSSQPFPCGRADPRRKRTSSRGCWASSTVCSRLPRSSAAWKGPTSRPSRSPSSSSSPSRRSVRGRGW